MDKSIPNLEECDQPLLATTVKLVNKLGLQSEQGPWRDYVKALNQKKRLDDPRRHEKQHLVGFLGSLVPSESSKKPMKLLARILQWQKSIQQEVSVLGPHHLLAAPGHLHKHAANTPAGAIAKPNNGKAPAAAAAAKPSGQTSSSSAAPNLAAAAVSWPA